MLNSNAPLSRRDFLITASLAGVAAAALASPALGLVRGFPAVRRPMTPGRSAATFHTWLEPAPGFWVAVTPTADMNLVAGNSTLVEGTGQSLLIDTKQCLFGPSLKREAKYKQILGPWAKFDDSPSSAIHLIVLNTHHHLDHSGGNGAFAGKSTKLIGHAKCRERVQGQMKNIAAGLEQKITALEALQQAGAKEAAEDARAFKATLATLKPEAFVPETVEAGPEHEYAGRKAELHHVGAGHTDNDLFVFFPKENVLVTGDLVFNGLHPYYDASAGANSAGWVRSLARMVSFCNEKTIVVPGHGLLTNIEGVKKQIKYFEDVQAFVAKAIKEGKPREEVAKMTLPQYGAYELKVAQPLVMGGVYDEQKPPAPKLETK